MTEMLVSASTQQIGYYVRVYVRSGSYCSHVTTGARRYIEYHCYVTTTQTTHNWSCHSIILAKICWKLNQTITEMERCV